MDGWPTQNGLQRLLINNITKEKIQQFSTYTPASSYYKPTTVQTFRSWESWYIWASPDSNRYPSVQTRTVKALRTGSESEHSSGHRCGLKLCHWQHSKMLTRCIFELRVAFSHVVVGPPCIFWKPFRRSRSALPTAGSTVGVICRFSCLCGGVQYTEEQLSSRGDWTTNPPVTGQPALPNELRLSNVIENSISVEFGPLVGHKM